MFRTEEQWIQVYQDLGALWFYGGDPTKSHAVLTSSGNHSDGFFNSRLVIADNDLLWQAASDLVEKLTSFGVVDLSLVDVVVGPQTGATKLAKLIAEAISARTGKLCLSASPEKMEVDGVKSMRFSDQEAAMLQGKRILLVDDVNSTGGSSGLTAQAVVGCDGVVLSFVLVLVNRSGRNQAKGREIIALITRELSMWKPEGCPLCEQGSTAVRPKDNWVQLTT